MYGGLRKRIRKARARRASAALEGEIRRNQWLDADALRAYQLERVRRLCDHAYRTTRYYRELFDDIGLRVEDIRSLADFAEAVPPLEKSVVRERMEDLRSSGWRGRSVVAHTGGSTGIPLRFVLPKLSGAAQAIRTNVYDYMGLRGGERTIQLWGVDQPTYHVFHEKRNAHVFAYRWVPPSGLDTIVDLILDWRPEFIWGYVNALANVAEALERRGHTDVGVRVVQTFSEMLHDFQRERIERVFGAEAFDHYGSKEFGSLGIECSQHDGLHLFAQLRLFELEGCTDPGDGTGELLVTDFGNEAMPFLRFRIGDTLTLDHTPCPCGRGLPRARIDGRSIDQIVLRDGTRMLAGFFSDLMDPRRVSRFIVHQRSYDRIDCRIEPSDSFTDDFGEHLVREIRGQLGVDDVRLRLESELDPSVAGKYRLVRSDVANRPL